jgi:hypothetical protein
MNLNRSEGSTMIDRPSSGLLPETKAFRGNWLLYRKAGQGMRRPAGTCAPRFRHPSFEDAEAEARRLLGIFPESTFLILQERGHVKLKPAVVRKEAA